MPYEMDLVAEKLSGAVESFTRRFVAQKVRAVQWRLAQSLVHAGTPKLAIEILNKEIIELGGRVDALERINSTRGSDS
jgi:predicted Zn-dependent protease